jgi:hypothetical protein
MSKQLFHKLKLSQTFETAKSAERICQVSVNFQATRTSQPAWTGQAWCWQIPLDWLHPLIYFLCLGPLLCLQLRLYSLLSMQLIVFELYNEAINNFMISPEFLRRLRNRNASKAAVSPLRYNSIARTCSRHAHRCLRRFSGGAAPPAAASVVAFSIASTSFAAPPEAPVPVSAAPITAALVAAAPVVSAPVAAAEAAAPDAAAGFCYIKKFLF